MSTPVAQSFPRQLRLALVMNGGVSLAVWMSGVTHELNNCRLEAQVACKATSSRSAWADILRAANTTVTIDLIAGASAGGLNGTVLAKAIARHEDLPDMLCLWLERATISAEKLLAIDPEPADSILNGRYFFDQVRELLEGSTPCGQSPSETPTVSLLVTATALPIPDQDEQAGEVVSDSRRVYQFVARPGVPADTDGIADLPEVPAQNDFDTAAKIETLARAARASAGFPTAFQPVRETDDLRKHDVGQSASRVRWLMDGGVLDNAPFEPLLNELRRRAVSNRFSRAVVYINPSAPRMPPQNPRQVTAQPGADDARAPNIRTTLKAFVAATREPDRRLDVEGLDEALKMMGFTATDPDHVLARLFRPEDPGPMTPDRLQTAAAALFKQYQDTRRQSLFLRASKREKLRSAPRPPEDAEQLISSELLIPSERGIRPDLDWHWGLNAADEVLRWWGRALAERAPSEAQSDAFAALGPAQRRVRSWMDGFDDEFRGWHGSVLSWITAADAYLRDHNLPTLVAQVLRATADKVAPALDAPSGRDLLDAALDLEVVNRALSWRSEEATDVPSFVFWQITPAAKEPFPLGFTEAEYRDWPSKKLYGERWGHFGAFASKDGRRWDWLWGRLDAAMTVSSQVLSNAGIEGDAAARLQEKLVAAICKEEAIDQTEVVAVAQCVLKLDGRALWTEFRGGASRETRKSLRSLARKLPGALVPSPGWVAAHAVTDTGEDWHKHRPAEGEGQWRIRLYRFFGVVAQTVARRRVARLLRPDAGRSSGRDNGMTGEDASRLFPGGGDKRCADTAE
jgi:predicted acylesterase/phospholipase RssA